jgi:hypothetical protein
MPGYIWTESVNFKWTNPSGSVVSEVGTDTGSNATPGYIFIETTSLHWIDANGDERFIEGLVTCLSYKAVEKSTVYNAQNAIAYGSYLGIEDTSAQSNNFFTAYDIDDSSDNITYCSGQLTGYFNGENGAYNPGYYAGSYCASNLLSI